METSEEVHGAYRNETSVLYGAGETVFNLAFHEPAPYAGIPEALIQDIWLSQRFAKVNLTTTTGEAVRVIRPGKLNRDSGPDFSEARLRIGHVDWAGDVEIHLTSSGWSEHRHAQDARYDRVILHVALDRDSHTDRLYRSDGTRLPELILRPYLDDTLRSLLYDFRTRRHDAFPCASQWSSVPIGLRLAWLRRMALERMEMKRDVLAHRSYALKSMDQALYEQLLAGLGYAKNVRPMLDLASRVPLSILRTMKGPAEVEALLFGVSGLLPEAPEGNVHIGASERYAGILRADFKRLNEQLQIRPMSRHQWTFFRLRPANFPTLRIAQAAALVTSSPLGLLENGAEDALLSCLSSGAVLQELRKVLYASPSPFWKGRVSFSDTASSVVTRMGRQRIDALIINVLAPALLLMADRSEDLDMEAAVLNLLDRLPPEKDEVTRLYLEDALKPACAVTTQGIHQLHRSRCTAFRCLSCAVGNHLLDRTGRIVS